MISILVLGTHADPHVNRVANEIRRRTRDEHSVLVLDYNDNTRFNFSVDDRGSHSLEINGKKLERYIVWDRQKLIPGSSFYIQGDEAYRGYAAQEWRSFYTLITGMNRGRVVNSPLARSCLFKPYQQTVAAHAGFLVPPTLITNDKKSALSFQSTNDSLVLKSVSGGRTSTRGEGEENPFGVMTMRVSSKHLEEAKEAELQVCPHFFQMEIDKKYQLRVVYINGAIYSFRIDSQLSRLSEVDWRKGMGLNSLSFKPHEPDEVLCSLISGFMTRMGLFAASLDLVVDKEGELWFIECNQDGAWGWLDDIVDGQITREFANAFQALSREIENEII